MTEFTDGPSDSAAEHEQRVRDISSAIMRVDPNHWIGGSIDAHRTRVQEVEMGVTTEYDGLSFDNDVVYKDGELTELYNRLEEEYDVAIRAVVALDKIDRAIRKRLDQLRDSDVHAQMVARKMVDSEEVTVQDIFPGAV